MKALAADTERPTELDVAAAIDAADLRVLLMCLVHCTGDLSWLEGIHRPVRDVNLVADESAGLSVEAQDRIRSAAKCLFSAGKPEVALARPDDELLKRMMSVCLGEKVPDEYVAMMREDMGFAPGDVSWQLSPDEVAARAQETDPIVIVGAGVSGLCLAAKLENLGLPYLILEKNADVGGTWFENTYPGCGVDTPNHFYSYSFRPNNQWKRFFAKRDEVQCYVGDCADDLGIRQHIRFGTEVLAARWNDERARWRIDFRSVDGRVGRLETRFFVSAIGQLNLPSVPDLTGLEEFRGDVFHSARWPEGFDVAGKRIAVVGTGASAMQLVPTIAQSVSHLTVFQRSAQWVRPLPGYDRHCPPGMEWLLEHVPFYGVWMRFTLFWRYGDGLHKVLQRDPAWPHPERSINARNDQHRQELAEHIHTQLAGHPDLIAKSMPNYPPWGKRMLVDNGWYTTILRDNVDLVTDGIDYLYADGIVTETGEHIPVDAIVLATGFKVTDMTARLAVQGRKCFLSEAWADDNPTAFLGITVPGFPNMFILFGPNTNVAHGGSIIFQAECQSRYITSCIVQMIEQSVEAVNCRPEVRNRYIADVDAAHERMVWTHPGMSTWYRNKHGRVIAPTPWRFVDYWEMTHEADLCDYTLFTLSGPTPQES